ncbi:DUF4174 domain-containing protein [Tropicimonas aquimaris]|uniref:DUF4174 domain-containing protein n=1 Tax=Tropicimonas aquimaris TaxID=914152 RepID=A0ABW3IQ66_9RHOB
MRRKPLTALLASLMLVAAASAQAQEASQAPAPGTATEGLQIMDAASVDIGEFLWLKRVLAVFADTPADPRYIQQMQLLAERPRDLVERDVIVITDTDPTARTEARRDLRPRGFALVLVDKDGVVKLRKPSPWSTREISRSIDKTPLRRDEIREGRGSTLTQ